MHRLPTGRSLAVAGLAAAALLTAATSDAQTPHLRSNVELVPLTVTVRDPGGRKVSGLRRDDFELYENGRAQSIAFFERERVPLILTVILDTSRSMAPRLAQAKSTGEQVLGLLQAGDIGAIVDSSGTVRQPPTTNVQVLRTALSDIVAGGTTSLYDAMWRATALTAAHSGGVLQSSYQRVMVVISDGGDTSSTMTLGPVLARIRSTGISVYAVRPHRDSSDMVGRIAQHLDREHVRTLQRIADSTGGQVFVDANPDSDSEGIGARIERAMSSAYVLAYSPETPAASEAQIAVRMKGRDLRVSMRRLTLPPSGASH